MLFQKKVDRALEKLHEESDSAKAERELDFQEEQVPLEKHDFLAMIIAAFLVFLPIAAVILGAIALIGYFFFMH
ncbi:MAG: hypothetical protein K1V96_00495 [Lachnospiraceae bacterium]